MKETDNNEKNANADINAIDDTKSITNNIYPVSFTVSRHKKDDTGKNLFRIIEDNKGNEKKEFLYVFNRKIKCKIQIDTDTIETEKIALKPAVIAIQKIRNTGTVKEIDALNGKIFKISELFSEDTKLPNTAKAKRIFTKSNLDELKEMQEFIAEQLKSFTTEQPEQTE